MNIGIVGLGVVGGTVRDALLDAGLTVTGYDRYLDLGEPADLSSAAVVFLCVSTLSQDDGSLETKEVWAAVRDIEPHLEDGAVVAVKSTVPPGTCDALAEAIPRLRFASLPEFLVATDPSETFRRPDRIVIGSGDGDVAQMLSGLMTRVAPIAPVVVVLPIEAELIKLCSNAMLAAKVTMANELFDVCRRFGVSWSRLQGVVGLDRRIGPDHLTVTAERGFGGVCLPKDLDGLIGASRGAGHDPEILRAVAAFNRRVRRRADGDGAPTTESLRAAGGEGSA